MIKMIVYDETFFNVFTSERRPSPIVFVFPNIRISELQTLSLFLSPMDSFKIIVIDEGKLFER